MNIVILLTLLASLFVSLFVIIPKFAPPGKENVLQNWVGLGFNALLFLYVLVETGGRYKRIYPAIAFFLFVVAFDLLATLWWIPSYISADKQANITKILFTVSSVLILLTNVITKAVPVTFVGLRQTQSLSVSG